jgi:hypothetical protein
MTHCTMGNPRRASSLTGAVESEATEVAMLKVAVKASIVRNVRFCIDCGGRGLRVCV